MTLKEIRELKSKYDSENSDTYKEFACIVDNEHGDPTCVIDLNDRDDCSFGRKYKKKEECPYWIEKERYSPKLGIDVWDWLEKQAT